MKVIISKLLHDFRAAKGKLILMLLAAALSSWGISSVIYGYMMAERDFKVNFASTHPADIELVVKNYQDGLVNKFLADSNVIDIERREVLKGKVKNRDGEWMPFTVYGVKDIQNMRLDVFKVLERDNQSPNEILIETNATYFLDSSNDSIEVRFPNRTVTFIKSGVSHDARLPPARMERVVFAHATSIDPLTPFLNSKNRRLLVKTNVDGDRGEIQRVSNRLKMIGASAGATVSVISIPVPGEHIHQNIVDGISFLQESMGIMLSIMGIILLLLILLTWVYPQLRDVGVMKAVGASTNRIFYSYSLTTLGIIISGMLIGVPTGYLTAESFNTLIAFIQNFEVVSDLLPGWVHLVVIITCLVAPFLFTVLPLSKASVTTVNKSMTQTFHTLHANVFRLSQTLITPVKLQYGINNLFRNSPRTLLTILLIATGLTLLFVSYNLEYSVNRELARFSETTRYQLRVKLAEVVEKPEIEPLSNLPFITSIAPMQDRTVTFQPSTTTFRETKNVRMLSKGHIIGDNVVIMGTIDRDCAHCLYISGEEMEQLFKYVDIGDTVELTLQSGRVKTFVFSGIFRDMASIGSPFFLFDSDDQMSINALAVETTPGLSGSEVISSIDQALTDNGLEPIGIRDVNTRIGSLKRHLEPTYLIIKVGGLFTILLGLLGMLIVQNLTLQERTREIGIMKSVGCSFKKISRLFILEFLLITLIAIFIGLLISIPLTTSIANVIAETVIYHPIPVITDFLSLGIIAVSVIGIQVLLVHAFNRSKIDKAPRSFLEYTF